MSTLELKGSYDGQVVTKGRSDGKLEAVSTSVRPPLTPALSPQRGEGWSLAEVFI